MPPVGLLLEQFERIGFHNEYGGAHREGRLVKWRGPLRARLNGPGADRYRAEFEAHFETLRRLTGLDIDFVDWWWPFDSNVEIELTTWDREARRRGEPPCRAEVVDRNFVLSSARIVISTNDPAMRRHCIVEELTQALGLLNDSPVLSPSTFNDESRNQALLPWDAILVRTLYDPRLEPGMPVWVAMPLARQILRELTAQYRRSAYRADGARPRSSHRR